MNTTFESSVNSEGIETTYLFDYLVFLFESSVNSEGIETASHSSIDIECLRAV